MYTGSRHVLDRFHAARWFTQGLTLVRRELQRRQPPGTKPAFEPDLFPGPVRSIEETRPPHPSRTETPRPAVRYPPAAGSRPGRSPRAVSPSPDFPYPRGL